MWAIGKRHRAPIALDPVLSRRTAGFTLIEALVVLAIAGLIAGIGFPGVMRAIAGWEFRASGAALEATLQDARALSLRTGRVVRFVTDAAQQRYGIAGEPMRSLEGETRIAASPATIAFYGDGSAGGGRITVTGSGGRQTILTVQPDTGLVGTLR